MTTTTKERPILFSGPMVRAILDGKKRQTRRPIKPQPDQDIDDLHGGDFRGRAPYAMECNETGRSTGFGFEDDHGHRWQCPFVPPGTLLWVRETWALALPWVDPDTGSADDFGLWPGPLPKEKPTAGWRVFYGADGDDFGSHPHDRHIKKYRPSIHMPHWASRITLRVKRVWVERVQDISEEDAQAEGIREVTKDGIVKKYCIYDLRDMSSVPWADMPKNPIPCFRDLWQSTYPGSWDANQWVWACEFEKA